MTGKGSGSAYQDNWELAFGKKKNTKQITKVTANIPFEMEGDPSFEDKINHLSKLLKENYLEKLIKEDKIYFDTITKHQELANDTFDEIFKPKE
jgi:hypothetical protein